MALPLKDLEQFKNCIVLDLTYFNCINVPVLPPIKIYNQRQLSFTCLADCYSITSSWLFTQLPFSINTPFSSISSITDAGSVDEVLEHSYIRVCINARYNRNIYNKIPSGEFILK